MLEEEVTYLANETPCKGLLVFDNTTSDKRPGILIAHTWKGLDEFAKLKARELAHLGFVAFAADLYGNGKQATSDQEAQQLMAPLFLDRALLRTRIQAAYETLKQSSTCDTQRIGAIGFCFGGLTVIELFCSGIPIKGAVSFHGTLGDTLGNQQANTLPIADHIKGSLLILHGHEDPLVSKEDIARKQKQLDQAKVDWQMHIYSHTSHAFTNPQAQDTHKGLIYNPQSAVRSWKIMQMFFKEILFESGTRIHE